MSWHDMNEAKKDTFNIAFNKTNEQLKNTSITCCEAGVI